MSQVRAVPVAASQLYAMPLFCLKPPHFRHHNTTASSRTIRIRGPVIMASHPRDDPEDGTDIMVAQFITLPRTLLVAGVLAMAPAAFAFAQTPTSPATSTPSTSTQATVGATTPASPAKVTVKQDATVKAPDTKIDSQAAATTPKTDVKPVTKKVASAKKDTPVKTEAKTESKTPATPAAQPKS